MKLKQLLDLTTIDTHIKVSKVSDDKKNPIVFETDRRRFNYDYYVFDECIEQHGYCTICQISVEDGVMEILIK